MGLPTIVELPFGLPGRVFRSAMPFSAYDPAGRALAAFRRHQVSLVVLLAEAEECRRHAGCDLVARYRDEEGWEVLHLPLGDGSATTPEALAPAVGRALAHLAAGRHLAVHCLAGRGRTGLFLACLARQALGLGGDEALDWVRDRIPGAVETRAQERLVRDYRPEPGPAGGRLRSG